MSILFGNPNFLILDEPTNDLDLPTLAVLENFLSEFQGCLLIVSHDRYFMDRLVDHLFVFEGEGVIRDFPGNYSTYRLGQKEQPDLPSTTREKGKADKFPAIPDPDATEYPSATMVEKRKLSFKEKREFEGLQREIKDLEREKITITEKLNGGNLPYDQLQELSNRIGEITGELDKKEFRWLELSELQ